jgi:hypothetical protein
VGDWWSSRFRGVEGLSGRAERVASEPDAGMVFLLAAGLKQWEPRTVPR